MRRFVGLKLSGALPDETTILNFRHLLERHSLGEGLLQEINAHLESQGLRLREGTIVDASIIEAPSSTKNRAGERDPAMHQTKKGNQWHFGMKAHIGVDSETDIVHSLSATAANVHDVTEAHRLLHGGEKALWGDAGCQGSTSGRRIWVWRWTGRSRCVRVRLSVRVRDVLSVVDQGTHGHSQFFRYLPKRWNQESALSVQNLVEPVAGMTQCGGHRICGSSPLLERVLQVPDDNGIDG